MPAFPSTREPGLQSVVIRSLELLARTERESEVVRNAVRAVHAEVEGEFVAGGATADDPPIGPPASYMVPGFDCPNP